MNTAGDKIYTLEKSLNNQSSEYKTLMEINSKLDRKLDVSLKENESLKLKVAKFESKLNETNITFKKLNAGSKALDDMLSYQKNAYDKTGLG